MAYAAAFLLLTVGILMRVLGHKAIAERSEVKKRQSGGRATDISLSSDGILARTSWELWLLSMRFLQFVKIISVRRKVET